MRSCYYSIVQSKCTEKEDCILNLYVLALLVSLKDPSLTSTASFSAFMPKLFLPTNHSTSFGRFHILSSVNLTDPTSWETQKSIAELPRAILSLCVHKQL